MSVQIKKLKGTRKVKEARATEGLLLPLFQCVHHRCPECPRKTVLTLLVALVQVVGTWNRLEHPIASRTFCKKMHILYFVHSVG